jgi:hypothetical protein
MLGAGGNEMFRSIAEIKQFVGKSHGLRIMALAVFSLVFASTGGAFGAAAPGKVFPSPEEAVKAMMTAVNANDQKTILEIFGPEAKAIINSGDPVADKQAKERFVKAYNEANKLVKSGDSKVVLQVGKDDWPFPIPVVKESSGWRFDTSQGKEEIINRRIGRNELDVIQVCLAYVDAQKEYYQRNPQKDPLMQFSQKFISTKGKRDGLYWESNPPEQPSPLGSLAAQARAAGYQGAGGGKPVPFHGYFYKILTSQGPNAPGGAYDYLVRGKMMGGFAMVAHPAQYGSSGIMTFIVSHDGIVYEKDLGSNTSQLASSMTKFNPDKTWKEAAKIR